MRSSYAGSLKAALDRAVNTLVRMPDVEKVIFFGSFASGRCDLFTDIDLLVVMRSSAPQLQRTAALYRSLDLGVDVDLIAVTPEELNRGKNSPFFRRILEKGKVLYEK
jgi:predicted nucleotidyltransferase